MELAKKLSIFTVITLLLSTNLSFAQNTSPKIYNDRNGNATVRVIESNIKTERLPIGTKIQLRIENPINSLNSSKGAPFIASIIKDIYVRNNLVLPSGTTVRGRIERIKENTYLSRGGELGLGFDLVETPLGRQLPIYADISKSKYLIATGDLSAGGGYIKALQQNLDEGVTDVTGISGYCIKKGLSFWHGYPVIITAPVGVAGGMAAGSYVFFSKSVSALYHKGENVRLNPGDVIEVTLKEPVDVPIN